MCFLKMEENRWNKGHTVFSTDMTDVRDQQITTVGGGINFDAKMSSHFEGFSRKK